MEPVLLLFLTPLAAALIVFFIQSDKQAKVFSLVVSLTLLGLLVMVNTAWIGSTVHVPWIPQLGIHFYLRLDPLSFVFVLLTLLVTPYVLITTKNEQKAARHFFGLVLLLLSLTIGFFTAQDLFLFTFLWEGMLIPLYFLILGDKGKNSSSVALNFILYMLCGSVFMVISVFALYLASGGSTFAMDQLALLGQNLPNRSLIFGLFALAFAVKTPLFPFHGWLPATYVESPTPVTLILAGILSKAGIYGFLRIGREIFPDQMDSWSALLLVLASIGVIYAGFAAYRQTDLKKLIAYSSLSHVNLILAGVFAANFTSQLGAIFQVFNHAVIVTALFLIAFWINQRVGSLELDQNKGLGKQMPWLCWITFLFILASIALPGTSGFIGELLILYGVFQEHPFFAAALALTIILSALYFLNGMRQLFFGPIPKQTVEINDLNAKDIWIIIPLVILVLGLGLLPTPLLEIIQLALESNR